MQTKTFLLDHTICKEESVWPPVESEVVVDPPDQVE